MNLLMPDIRPTFNDAYLCTPFRMNEQQPIYITEFNPNSTKEIAHHILIYGCEAPGSSEQVWNCGEMVSHNTDSSKQFEQKPVCGRGKQSIVYAWAMDAPKLVLPKDVAFKVGGNTKTKYLVMQVHYANSEIFKDGRTDNSGVILTVQNEPTKNIAGVYLLATDGYVKPHQKEYFESACEVEEDAEIIPFAFRTHAHKLAIVTSGYVVKTNPVSLEQEWIELGRRSPQLPQMFYPVTNSIRITKGDVLAARCTLYNYQDHKVSIGSTGADEMCNFYLMYYGRENKTLNSNICMTWGPPNWYFEDFKGLDVSKIPDTASVLPLDQMKELPKMSHMHHMTAVTESNESAEKETTKLSSEDQEESVEVSPESSEDDLENYLSVLEQKQALRKMLQKYFAKQN